MLHRPLVLAATALLCLGVAAPATAAEAAPARFSNCSAVHAVYSGGIAKDGVTRNTVTSHGKRTTRPLRGTVQHSTQLYSANRGLDRDRDGVACEKS